MCIYREQCSIDVALKFQQNRLDSENIKRVMSESAESYFFTADEIFEKLNRLTSLNKPGTAKVGAISKAQICKRGDPLGFVKLQLVVK